MCLAAWAWVDAEALRRRRFENWEGMPANLLRACCAFLPPGKKSIEGYIAYSRAYTDNGTLAPTSCVCPT